jgi:hypothetical protein
MDENKLFLNNQKKQLNATSTPLPELNDSLELENIEESENEATSSRKSSFLSINSEAKFEESSSQDDEIDERKAKRIDSYKNFKTVQFENGQKISAKSLFRITEIPTSMVYEVILQNSECINYLIFYI